MLYTIENEKLKVEISDLGAEIMSIKSKATGHEYLWQGNDKYWANRATILFPICGRLTEGKYIWKGKEYEMVLHGFAKLCVFNVVEKTDTEITLELTPNEETRKAYPFDFVFRMTYTLTDTTIKNTFFVNNPTEEDLPFTVGGHPGFNIPFCDGEAFEDYYLEFKCEKPTERLIMSPTCFYTGKNEPMPLKDGKIIELRHDLFDNDGVFMNNMCRCISLKSKKNNRAVTLKFEDMKHYGLWQKPHSDAPYVCIEPWCGVPAIDGVVDDFATKVEMSHLAKGESFSTYFDITITE